MDAAFVMCRMTFRTLDDITEPSWCCNVRMLENRKKVRCQKDNCHGQWRKPDHKRKANRNHNGKPGHVKWAEIKRPQTYRCVRRCGAFGGTSATANQIYAWFDARYKSRIDKQ